MKHYLSGTLSLLLGYWVSRLVEKYFYVLYRNPLKFLHSALSIKSVIFHIALPVMNYDLLSVVARFICARRVCLCKGFVYSEHYPSVEALPFWCCQVMLGFI